MLHRTSFSYLPVELWEKAIDNCCQPLPIDIHLVYATWRTCALTCRAWVPRSRYNLLYDIQPRNEREIDLFLRIITEQPFLAQVVYRITIDQRATSPGVKSFVPFARLTSISSLRSCPSLDLRGIHWDAYPARYIDSLTRFTSIRELKLDVDGQTIARTLHLIRSFRELRRLELRGRPADSWRLSEEYARKAEFSQRRKQDVCAKLECLKFFAPLSSLEHFPPRDALGKSVTRLELYCDFNRFPPSASMLECISSFHRLQTIAMHVDFGYLPMGEPDDKYLSILNVVSAVRSYQCFSSLAVTLTPSDSDGYLLSRAAVLGILGAGTDLQRLLQTFPRFRRLRFEIGDSDSSNARIWRESILARMPDLGEVVEVASLSSLP